MSDQALVELGPILEQIVVDKYDDVRNGMRDLIGSAN